MPEPTRHIQVDRVDWSSIVYFPKLASAFRLAVQPNRLIMGLAMVVLLMIPGNLWDTVTDPVCGPDGVHTSRPSQDEIQLIFNWIDSDLDQTIEIGEPGRMLDTARSHIIEHYNQLDPEAREQALPQVQQQLQMLDRIQPVGVFEGTTRYIRAHFADMTTSAIQLSPTGVINSIHPIITELPVILWQNHRLFFILYGIWFALVWMIGGCMLSRSMACEFAITQYIPWTEALAYSLKRWLPLAGSVVFPIVAVIMGFVALAAGGWLLKIPGLNILGGLLYAPALFGGFVITCLCVLGIISSGLFAPAVAVESADAPDALARGFSYAKNRPLHLLFYLAITLTLGLLGYLVILLFASLTINLTAWGTGLWGGGTPAGLTDSTDLTHIMPTTQTLIDAGPTEQITVALINLWRTLIGGLVAGFVISYHFAAWTMMYFLMRKATDDQDLEEIWLPGMIEGTIAPERTEN